MKKTEQNKTKKIAILTSGGDAPGMNTAINAVFRAIRFNNYKRLKKDPHSTTWELVLIKDGYRGILEKKFITITQDWEDKILSSYSQGGTIIGSSRFLELKNDNICKAARDILRSYNISTLIAIGGDGTYKGLAKLNDSKFAMQDNYNLQCIGIPGTIDNDVVTTEYTIGFDTALNTVVEALDKIRDTSNSHRRITLVEIMGRRCADLTIYSAPATDLIVTPEIKQSLFQTESDIIDAISDLYNRLKLPSIVVGITEGLFKNLADLATKIENKIQVETRTVVLGSIQRGGRPSAFDRYLATTLGRVAIEHIEKDQKTSCVIAVEKGLAKVISLPDAISTEVELRKEKSFYHKNKKNKAIKLLNLNGFLFKQDI